MKQGIMLDFSDQDNVKIKEKNDDISCLGVKCKCLEFSDLTPVPKFMCKINGKRIFDMYYDTGKCPKDKWWVNIDKKGRCINTVAGLND